MARMAGKGRQPCGCVAAMWLPCWVSRDRVSNMGLNMALNRGLDGCAQGVVKPQWGRSGAALGAALRGAQGV